MTRLRTTAATLTIGATLLGVVTSCSGDPAVVAQAAGRTLIDVRTPAEFAGGHLQHALNIDVQSPTFNTDIGRLDRGGKYLVYCRSGSRAEAAITTMRGLGFPDLINGGGFEQLESAGVPTA